MDVDSYYDLGGYAREVTASNDEARLWFNRGLIWCYGFFHEEALRCFEQALRCDPDCAMAYWGTAYAAGPYYNKQWVRFDSADLARTTKRTYEMSRRAAALKDGTSAVEQALIDALLARFQFSEPVADFTSWNDDYADAMRGVHAAFPHDPDVCTLFADAMMNRTPWAMWDLATVAPNPKADTEEALRVVEAKMAEMDTDGEAPHAGLLHYHIHLLEMSPEPERALRSADRLRPLASGSGHLNHMPTHIDAQCGRYELAVTSNQAAAVADQEFVKRHGLVNFHALSRAHNFHFMMYAAMLLGHSQAAEEAAQGIVETIPEELLRRESPPMADWLEGYVAMQVHPLIRFGNWQDILAVQFPNDRQLYCSTTALLHYARTLALAVLGEIATAEDELKAFREAASHVPASRMVFNNTVRDILVIADAMAVGELEYRKGSFATAFDSLRVAVKRADELPYDEPWGWMQPARHALGALLLEQGHVEEAAAVYRADLGLDDTLFRCCRHPDNVWALHGYHECLTRLGKTGEAQAIAPKLEAALARADVPIRASCLCRLDCAS